MVAFETVPMCCAPWMAASGSCSPVELVVRSTDATQVVGASQERVPRQCRWDLKARLTAK